MKEYLPKNPNEYDLDGKRYVEKINRCFCREQKGGSYELFCKIHQRGEHFYTYGPGDDHISKNGLKDKGLYLSGEAAETVQKTVACFDKAVEKAREWRSVKVPCRGSFLSIYYYQLKGGDFAYFLEGGEGEDALKKFYGLMYEDPLHRLLYDAAELLYGRIGRGGSYERHDAVVSSTKKTIAENPLYRAAIGQNDELFATVLKLHFGIADDGECEYLSKLLGCRVLPALSEEYDKDYYVGTGGLDFTLLYRSGYRMLHRPNFGMMGSTREGYTLNPHRKTGVDAVPAGAGAISFGEYLKLFDGRDGADGKPDPTDREEVCL